jgi:hypothetical protein
LLLRCPTEACGLLCGLLVLRLLNRNLLHWDLLLLQVRRCLF